MTKWKLVPVEATREMVIAATEGRVTRDGLLGTYRRMVAGAPQASEDEALVEQVARALARREIKNVPLPGDNEDRVWPIYVGPANAWIAILAELEGKKP
jgi:hypothetical protein